MTKQIIETKKRLSGPDLPLYLVGLLAVLAGCMGLLEPATTRCVEPLNSPTEVSVPIELTSRMPMIAHRASGVAYADRIVLKDNGSVYFWSRDLAHEMEHVRQWKRLGPTTPWKLLATGKLEAEAERAERAIPDTMHLTVLAPCK